MQRSWVQAEADMHNRGSRFRFQQGEGQGPEAGLVRLQFLLPLQQSCCMWVAQISMQRAHNAFLMMRVAPLACKRLVTTLKA